MRLAESLTQDWLNKNESREMVMLTITLLYIINWLTTTLTGTLPNSQPTVQTFFNNWLWKAGTLTLDKRLLTNVNHYRRLTNDLSTMWTTSKNRLLTPQLNLTNNTRASNQLQSMDRNWPMIDDKLNTSPSPISSWLNWPISFNGPDLQCITSSPDKHYSLDSEDDFCSGCRNVSHRQQFFSELPSPGWSHYTN